VRWTRTRVSLLSVGDSIVRQVAHGRRNQTEGADKNTTRVRQTTASTKIWYGAEAASDLRSSRARREQTGDLNEPQATTQLQGSITHETRLDENVRIRMRRG
jgi:hypothetical protein